MKWLVLLGSVVVASMLVGCRDEDLDAIERASRVAAARAEAARLHAGASFGIQRWNEVESIGPLNQAAGFDVVVPRGLPDGSSSTGSWRSRRSSSRTAVRRPRSQWWRSPRAPAEA